MSASTIQGQRIVRMRDRDGSRYLRLFNRWQGEYHPHGERLLFSVRYGYAPRWGHGFRIHGSEVRWGRLRRLRSPQGQP